MATKSDNYFAHLDTWAPESRLLRTVVLSAGLIEEWKWRQPCYTHQGRNIVMIAPRKNHATLSFFQGVLLVDEMQVLTSPGKNSQSVRLWNFTSTDQIEQNKNQIEGYLAEAVGHAEAGTQVKMPAKEKLKFPDELIDRFETVDGLEDAFTALTPGRQRGFVLNIESAKQSKTRLARVDKHTDRILAGKGIHDCYCGKSQRMPRCDGSHSR